MKDWQRGIINKAKKSLGFESTYDRVVSDLPETIYDSGYKARKRKDYFLTNEFREYLNDLEMTEFSKFIQE